MIEVPIILGLCVIIAVLAAFLYEMNRDNKRVRRRLAALSTQRDKLHTRVNDDRDIGRALRRDTISPKDAAALLEKEVEL